MTKIVCGVIGANSDQINQEAFQWEFQKAIDLTYELFLQDLEGQGLTEEEIEIERDSYLGDNSTYLLGDWKRLDNGQFVPDIKDTPDNYAAVFDTDSNIITVEHSKRIVECYHTSPCYMMRDGTPCGDLDTQGNSVKAYSLPKELLTSENKILEV